jgi:glutathione peroxidase
MNKSKISPFTRKQINNMKTLLIIMVLVLTSVRMNAQGETRKSFYDFTVTTIDGKEFPLSQLKGKKVLVVNTASKCGHTPQYADLEKLYETYGGDKFTIIGFPANNFLSQEPGTNEEIKQFCTSNYGVSFPMMSKISVKGKDIAPLYNWLTSKAENGVMDAPVKWNFQKFMIDENGNLSGVVSPSENPLSEKIVNWIKG